MSKLLVIGIDGMDPGLVQQWLPRLPALAGLARAGTLRSIQSVFPPDSLPAWTTIYTGMTPGRHGLLETIDYLTSADAAAADPSRFAGRTFWDEAGRRGRKVCVVNAFMAYPVWPVNGVMVSGPVFVSGQSQCYPPGILDHHPRAELGGVVEYPYRWDLGRFAQRADRAARDQAELALSLMASEDWDLFFLCLLTLDRVQHFFWRFHDPTDPVYAGPSAYGSVIFRHYRLMDDIVAALAAAAGPDTTVMVLSDHGHEQRPARLFHMNEWLRRRGDLAAGARGRGGARRLETAKNAALSIAARWGAEDLLYAAARLIPKQERARLKDSNFAFEPSASRAYVGKLGGSGRCGGVVIGPAAGLGESRAALALELTQALLAVRDPNSGSPIVESVRPREQVLSGPYSDQAPDLLYTMAPGYGVSRAVFGPLFSPSPTHRRVSGGHGPQGIVASNRVFGPGRLERLDQVHDAVLGLLDS